MAKDNIIKLRAVEAARRKRAAERQRLYRERQAETRKGVTGHDGYMIEKALACAVKAIENLPPSRREGRELIDMTAILRHLVKDESTFRTLLDDAAKRLDGPGERLAREVRFLAEEAEQPAIMMMFLFQAIQEFAREAAVADPEIITKETNGRINGRAWMACAKQVLAKREADAAI